MNVYFNHCEGDQLLAKAAKCRLLAETASAAEAARSLRRLADDYKKKAQQIERGFPAYKSRAAKQTPRG